MTRDTVVEDLMLPTDEALHPDHPVAEAAARMRAARLPLLPVVDGDEIVGIYTLQDLAHRKEQPSVPPAAEDSRAARVSDHLTAEIPYCYGSDSLATARDMLRRTGHSWLLVVNDRDEYIGLVGTDALAAQRSAPAKQAPPPVARTVTATGRAHGDGGEAPGGYSVRPKLRR